MTTYGFCVPATVVFSVRAQNVSEALRDAQAIVDRAQPIKDIYLSGPPNHDVKLWLRSGPLTTEHLLATVRREEDSDER